MHVSTKWLPSPIVYWANPWLVHYRHSFSLCHVFWRSWGYIQRSSDITTGWAKARVRVQTSILRSSWVPLLSKLCAQAHSFDTSELRSIRARSLLCNCITDPLLWTGWLRLFLDYLGNWCRWSSSELWNAGTSKVSDCLQRTPLKNIFSLDVKSRDWSLGMCKRLNVQKYKCSNVWMSKFIDV